MRVYGSYAIAVLLLALGVFGDSRVCLAGGVLVAVVSVLGEVLAVAVAVRKAGQYGPQVAAALAGGGFVTWPTRMVLRRVARPS